MVDAMWLKSNPDFDHAKRIADNGKAWGDTENPEEIESRMKQAIEEKAELKRKREENGGGSSKKKSKGTRKGNKKGKDVAGGSKAATARVEMVDDEEEDLVFD
jgi:chromatin remodeling complex protein RSC6